MLIATALLQTRRQSLLGDAREFWQAHVPGLFGSLVLSLALVRLLQQPWLQFLYKTPLALALGLTLFLLPRALLLRFFLVSEPSSRGIASGDAARRVAFARRSRDGARAEVAVAMARRILECGAVDLLGIPRPDDRLSAGAGDDSFGPGDAVQSNALRKKRNSLGARPDHHSGAGACLFWRQRPGTCLFRWFWR